GTCFAVWDSLLVMGGTFTQLDSLDAHGVVAYDGASWKALGSNIVPHVLDITVHNGHLFASGYAHQGGSIAEFDGLTWNIVDASPACVRCVASYGGRLHAAGEFSSNQIAAWDGTNWIDLPSQRVEDSIISDPIVQLMSYQSRVVFLRNWSNQW